MIFIPSLVLVGQNIAKLLVVQGQREGGVIELDTVSCTW